MRHARTYDTTGTPECAAPAAEGAQTDRLIDELAESICRRGLGTCAVLLFESVQPLNFIGSQMLYVLGPFASVFVDTSRWTALAEALEDRTTLDRLIARIEEKERGPSPKN